MSGSLGKSAVTFGLALLGGIVGAVFGWIITGFAADAILSVGGMSDINGAAPWSPSSPLRPSAPSLA